ncbi:MAG: hypothetical protein IPJ19_17080 [Planctomycetes bacterium]|nr:hypothetical protein [Planctomycetota bacterium]
MFETFSSPLANLCLALLLGRVLLSFLPAGEPGGHAPRALPVTLAASLVLGLGAVLALRTLFGPSWAIELGAGAAGALVRWATLPAGIVPPRDPARERPSLLSRLIYTAAFAPAILYWTEDALGSGDPAYTSLQTLRSLSLCVLLVGVEHGLALARRAPLGRRIFVLVLSLYVYRENAQTAALLSESYARIAAACWACGAAFALAWLRRADRRSALLALACFVVGRPWSALEGMLLVAAALVALVLCTSAPSRGWMAKAAGIAFAIAWLPALRGMSWDGVRPSASPLPALGRLALVVALLATAAYVGRAIAARARPEHEEWREELARGDRLLLLLGAATALVCGVLPAAGGSFGGASGMQVAAAIAFLLAGCVSIRPERAP